MCCLYRNERADCLSAALAQTINAPMCNAHEAIPTGLPCACSQSLKSIMIDHGPLLRG